MGFVGFRARREIGEWTRNPCYQGLGLEDVAKSGSQIGICSR